MITILGMIFGITAFLAYLYVALIALWCFLVFLVDAAREIKNNLS